jgi:hypothetical protein
MPPISTKRAITSHQKIIGHTKSTTYGIDIKVRVLDKHNNIEGLNRLIGFQPFPLLIIGSRKAE